MPLESFTSENVRLHFFCRWISSGGRFLNKENQLTLFHCLLCVYVKTRAQHFFCRKIGVFLLLGVNNCFVCVDIFSSLLSSHIARELCKQNIVASRLAGRASAYRLRIFAAKAGVLKEREGREFEFMKRKQC